MDCPFLLGLELEILGEIAINTETFDTLYPVEINKVAYVKTTEEPVFVQSINGFETVVVRPVNKDGYVMHQQEGFSLGELESEKAKFVRQMEFTKFTLEQRDLFTKARQAASRDLDEEPLQAKLDFGGMPN